MSSEAKRGVETDDRNAAIADIGPRLRGLRRARALRVADLARQSGYSSAFVSQVENGITVPSLSALAKLAGVLDIPVSTFFPPLPPAPRVFVTRADNPDKLRLSPNARDEYTVLNGRGRRSAFTAVIHHAHPASAADAERQVGERFVFVLSGSAELVVRDRYYRLQAGDMAHFAAHFAHRFTVTSSEPAEILWLFAPPLLS